MWDKRPSGNRGLSSCPHGSPAHQRPGRVSRYSHKADTPTTKPHEHSVAVGQLLPGLDKTGTKVPPHRQVPLGASGPATRIGGEVIPDWRNRYTRRPQKPLPSGVQVRSLHRGPPQQPRCGSHIVPVVASWCARTGMLPGPLSPGRAGRVDPQRCVATTSHPLPRQEHITRPRQES